MMTVSKTKAIFSCDRKYSGQGYEDAQTMMANSEKVKNTTAKIFVQRMIFIAEKRDC
ncbi:MAG: hypothetical protein LBR10_07210 [Prevotellaceae bacterium]|jgi:hypothetical protein|nr:hypothetical protein [Prevotellaceae bacterium]